MNSKLLIMWDQWKHVDSNALVNQGVNFMFGKDSPVKKPVHSKHQASGCLHMSLELYQVRG